MLRYGLRPAYRQAWVDMMRTRTGRNIPDPVTEDEISGALAGLTSVPQRFLDMV